MEIIGRISKGSKMDQIYISKERAPGFEIGESVLIKPILKTEISTSNYFFYNVKSIEPIKNIILGRIFNELSHLDNVIITGSFLEKGFSSLKDGGRMSIISFHSLEDRIVKNFFREKAKEKNRIF